MNLADFGLAFTGVIDSLVSVMSNHLYCAFKDWQDFNSDLFDINPGERRLQLKLQKMHKPEIKLTLGERLKILELAN